jgi:hypothetical protein
VRLARVFEDSQPIAFGDTCQRPHVRHLAVEVHRHHVGGVFRHRFGLADIQVVVAFADIDDDGNPAGLDDRLEARGEGGCRDDHAGARIDGRGEQGEA